MTRITPGVARLEGQELPELNSGEDMRLSEDALFCLSRHSLLRRRISSYGVRRCAG